MRVCRLDARRLNCGVEARDRFEPAPALSWEQLRAERLHELRWWYLDDIESATTEGVWFSPRRLGGLLRQLLDDGPPATPLDTGV